MTRPIKELDIFSALPQVFAPTVAADLGTPLPTREDPETLVATLKTQAKLLKLFEERGHIDGSGRNLGQELQEAITSLELILREETHDH